MHSRKVNVARKITKKASLYTLTVSSALDKSKWWNRVYVAKMLCLVGEKNRREVKLYEEKWQERRKGKLFLMVEKRKCREIQEQNL